MSPALLVISRGEQTRQVALSQRVLTIGRHPQCDVVLESDSVSRHHARLFADPFDRWIIEDLGSRHGVVVRGRKVGAYALVPGEAIRLGPYTLVLQPPAAEIGADPSSSTGRADLSDAVTGVTTVAAAAAGLAGARLRELNRLVERLDTLSTPAELYPEVCRCLATAPKTAALVVRLPVAAGALAAGPEILCCQVNAGSGAAAPGGAAGLHLSRRVLELVRGSDDLVMAQSSGAADAPGVSGAPGAPAFPATLTVVDVAAPRVVLSARVGQGAGSVDALYLDLPLPAAGSDLPEFVQGVVRHLRLVRRNLLLLEAKAQRQVLDAQLDLARQIQQRLVPGSLPAIPGVELGFRYQPALWVGGDYCDLWLLPDQRLAFAVGDVAGKGLAAALVMANLQAALRTSSRFCAGPAAAMEQVNVHLADHLPDGLFVTFFLGYLDCRRGQLEYVNAGHVPPLRIAAGAGARPLGDPANMVLGLTREPLVAQTIQLSPGEALLAVTDGITEAHNPAGQLLGDARLREAVARQAGAPARQLVEAAVRAAAEFRAGGPQHDDVTVLAVRWCGGEGEA